jgi:hypothetical protein
MGPHRYLAISLSSVIIVFLLMLPSILLPVASIGSPLMQGTLTPTAFIYLPYVVRQDPLPTSTPVPGCTTAPALISPSNGSSPNTLIPLFQWDSGSNSNATELNLEIWLDPELTQWAYGLTCTGCGTQGIYEWRPYRNLDPATTHYWRAYLMCDSAQGPYSEVWSFTTGSGGTTMPGPNLLSPANGSTLAGTTATLQWSVVSDAVEYLVNYTDADYPKWKRVVSGTATTIYALRPNAAYKWWVQARNDYAWGDESAHWEFTTGASGSSLILTPSPVFRDHIVVGSDSMTTVFEIQDTGHLPGR